MKKLVILLFLSLAIESWASDTYIYPPGLDSAIQHWQYPNTAAMTTDFGFYSQDIGKIAFNIGNGTYYYLSATTPTWTPLATGGGGGSTTFIGLVDVPSSYTGAAGQLVAVNGTATGLVFQAATGGGNVSNVGTPAAEENTVWTDSTHVKGTRTLSGGSTTYVLSKLSNTDYDYGWAAPSGGSTVSITAATPILVTPSPVTGTGVISLDPTSDLAALEALTGGNTIYYRSGTSAWSPVTIGSNLTFSGGILAATVGGTGTNAFGTVRVSGQSDVVASAAPDVLTLAAGSNVTLTTNTLTKTVTLAAGGGGVTSISATSPIQVSPNPIIGTGTISLESGSDLAALEALTGTNTIYYRSGISAWSPVTIGSNMTFSAGSLAAGNANWDTGYSERRQWDGGSTNLNATLGRSSLGATSVGANVFTLVTPASTSWLKITTLGSVVAEDAPTTKTSLGLNTANWDAAYTDRMKWDTSLGISGGTTGQGRTALGATTVGSNFFTLANPVANTWAMVSNTGTVTLQDAPTTKSSLVLTSADVGLGSVTNDAQTKAAIMPNTAPAAGRIPVGNAGGTAYAPQAITGSGATISLSSTGVLSIGAIPNASLSNSSVTIGNAGAVLLGNATSTDAILGTVGQPIAYLKRTASNTISSVTAIPNADLVSSTTTIGNAGAVSLGGAASMDAMIGMVGLPAGIVKRSNINTYINAVAGADYKVGTQNSVNVVLFTASTTYTATAGIQAIYVECVGGGGGGGGASSSTVAAIAVGGGGGGGYAAAYLASPVASYTVTIGGGGAGGLSTGATGATGGTTSFGATSVCTATGGAGGVGVNGAGGAGVWSSGGVGGAGTVGSVRNTGSDGGIGMAITSVASVSGTGGGSYFGGSTQPRANNGATATGNAGALYGGGGSGAIGFNAGAAGGAGAAGVVRVWEIF